MTTLAPTRPMPVGATSGFLALAAREMRRFVVNPVFLLTLVVTAFVQYEASTQALVDIDLVIGYPAIFLGGIGLTATYWQTHSTRVSEPLLGVTPTTPTVRTAALCTVALLPFLCGILSLLAFIWFQPIAGDWIYGAFSTPTRIAMLFGQIALPTLGGPLLGIALGRWLRFPGAGFVLFLVLYGWVSLTVIVSFSHANPLFNVFLRLFGPFAFWVYIPDNASPGDALTTWRGSPWFFLAWQLALCAIAVLLALLRGAEGRTRNRIVRALAAATAIAVVMLVLAALGGHSHTVTTG